MGTFQGSALQYILPITVIALFSSFIESLPFKDVDNITVTLTAILFGHILL
jgi:positive regulator of sigma E activity